MANVNGAQAGQDTPQTSTPQGNWSPKSESWLTPDLAKQYPSLSKFKDVGSLAKGYTELEKSFSRRPTAPTAPESPDAYQFEFGEGVQIDEGLVNGFKEFAHSNGLTQETAAKLVSWYTDLAQNYASQQGAPDISAQVTQWEGQMKQEFGSDYEANLDLAHRTAATLINEAGGPNSEMFKFLDRPEVGANPQMIKIMLRLSSMLGEDKFVDPSSDSSIRTRGDVVAERAEIRRSEAWMNPQHPQHQEAVAALNATYR